jgi:hypothetical protein
MSKRIYIAVLPALLSLSAISVVDAGPRRNDDTNRTGNKSTGG